MLVLTFEINLKSNYHIGAGYGKGFNLDSALLREAGGRAVIRGTALSGLLRDGARRLLELPVMGKHQSDKNEILGRLFGIAAQAKHWRIGSAYPVGDKSDDSQAVQRVRIDPVTRRAEPKKLFSQEEGLAGQVFRFTVTCPEHDAPILDEAALLVAAARNVRQMGRSRRRGLGECVIHLTSVEGMDESGKLADESWESYFLKRFNEVWLRGTLAPIIKKAIKSDISPIETAEGEPVQIRVIIRLDEPLLVARRGSAGNQFETNSFIPGSVLLGALATKAAGRCDLACPDTYRDFVTLFRRNGVTFPMLYPACEFNNNLYPAIPAPLGLLTCSLKPFIKAHEDLGHGLYPARAIKESNGGRQCPECQNKMEPVDKFLVLKRDMAGYMPRQTTEMHIKINDATQRVNKGDLFGYTALEARQYFTGDLVCANENAWRSLQKMCGITEKTPLVLYLGKGRQRGYGRVTMWLELFDGHAPTWIQKPLKERVLDPAEEICLTFLTDTIIADPWGRQAAGLQTGWLESTLGLGPLEIKDAYAGTRIVDSFNATLGLPRWRDLALTGGSTVWLQLINPPSDWEARMRKLEAEGIGWRRNEGFGCIAFNHPIYEHNEEIRSSAIRLEPQMRLSMQPTPDTFAEQWEKKLDESYLQAVNLDDSRFTSLARWLYTNSGKEPKELKRELEDFGDSKRDEKFIDAVGGKEEYGEREVSPFFKTDQQKKVIKVMMNLLDGLQKRPSIHWRPGIEQLAERIAMLSRKKGDE